MSIPIIEFSEVDDYVAYLQGHGRHNTHLDLSVVMGDSDKHSIRTVTFWAAASSRFCEFDAGGYIATLGVPLLQTTNFDLDLERRNDPERPTRAKVRERLATLRAELEARGLKCEPGRWLNQAPVYLR